MGTLLSSSTIITWPENLSKKLIQDLIKGKKFATQLQTLLHNNDLQRGSISAVDLADKILISFTDLISMLMNYNNSDQVQCSSDHERNSSGTVVNGGQYNEVVSQLLLVNAHQEPLDHHSHCTDDTRSSEDSGETSKKKRSSPGFKDRRGCYKRRKSSHSWSSIGSTIEDGQAWRKYGQKEILNAQYPRAYFRCTRKHDQGCKATKQVQQIQDNPKIYNTTYIGQHTCKNILKAPQMIVDNSQSNFNIESRIDFNNHQQQSRILLPLKEEESDDQVSSEDQSLFDTDNYLWSDFKDDIELSDPTMGLLSSPDNKSTFSFIDQTVDFRDCDFHFDETDFPIGSV